MVPKLTLKNSLFAFLRHFLTGHASLYFAPERGGTPRLLHFIRKRVTLINIRFGVVLVHDALTHVFFPLALPTDTYVVIYRVITLTTMLLLVLVIRMVILRVQPPR